LNASDAQNCYSKLILSTDCYKFDVIENLIVEVSGLIMDENVI